MMRLMLILFLVPLFSPEPLSAQRKKVGVVLSGGGAKGVTHVGVLKVLEEAGVPVDYIVGTSMGAIIGGLYAIGYDAATLDSLVRVQDWAFLLSDRVSRRDLPLHERLATERYTLSLPFDRSVARRPMGMVDGQNIYTLLTDLTRGYHGETDYLGFPIPFACVAADLITRQELVMTSGDLARSMRASMAIPGFFTPVSLDGMYLVDGGVLNNFPTDVIRAMGADIVIGVDVQAELFDAEQLGSVTQVLPQLINLLCMNKYRENLQLADILIQPDISGYSAASFNARAIDTLLRRGEEAAGVLRDSLFALGRSLRPEGGATLSRQHAPVRKMEADTIRVSRVRFTGITPQEERWVRTWIRWKDDRPLTQTGIHRAVNRLYGTHYFSSVSYLLTPSGQEQEMELTFELTRHPMNYFNFGFRFDTEELAAILLNTSVVNRPFRGAQLSLTGRLSRNPYLRMDLSLGSRQLPPLTLSGEVRYNDIRLYRQGEKVNNVVYRYYLAELGLGNLFFPQSTFRLGARYEYYDYNAFLFTDNGVSVEVPSEGFVSYFGTAHFETFDRSYFPERGVQVKADYTLVTDNFISYDEGAPFSTLSARVRSVIPVTRRLKMLAGAFGRVVVGNDPPYSHYNFMGGVEDGRRIAHQFGFLGIPRTELFDRALLGTSFSLRQRMGEVHYLSIGGNAALKDDNLGDIFATPLIYGAGITYSRSTALGPLSAVLSWSNHTHRIDLYLNLGFHF